MIRPLIPIVDYLLHFDYVVENLCINKDKPLLLCYGSCYVSEKLASENYLDLNNHKSKPENSKIEIFSPVFVLEKATLFTFQYFYKLQIKEPYFFKFLKSICYIKADFKPPKF